jgi:hypothetical protein
VGAFVDVVAANRTVDTAFVPARPEFPAVAVTGAVPAAGPIPNIVGIPVAFVAIVEDALETTGAVPAAGPIPSIVGISSREVAAFVATVDAAGFAATGI